MNRQEFKDFSFIKLNSGDWGVLARETVDQESQTGEVIEVEKKNGDISEVRLGERIEGRERFGNNECWVKYEIES